MASSTQKTTQKKTKMTVSAYAKTFENLNLKNYRSDISETCPLCVTTEHLSFTENWNLKFNVT